MVDGLRKQGGGDRVAEFDQADAAGKHELDFSAADFLVELHCGEDLSLLRRVQLHPGWQPGALEDAFDALHIACRQAEDLRRELRGYDLADGDRFPMQILAIVRDSFESM